MHHQDRYVAAETNTGWPIAAGVVALAIICALGALTIHKKTYKHPTDPTWHATGQSSHEPVPAGH